MKEDIKNDVEDDVEDDGYSVYFVFDYQNIFFSSMWAFLGLFTGVTIIKLSNATLEHIINVIKTLI